MEIKVRVVPNSSKQEVIEINGILKVHLNSPPIEGRANKELIKALAEHFSVKKSQVEIIRGAKNRVKTVRISKW